MPKLTLKQTLIGLTALLVMVMVVRPQAADFDIYWHLRSGEIMLDSGKVITGDLFSHTLPGVLRPHHEWLGEIVMALSYRALSDYGLTLLAGVFSMIALWLMYRLTTGSLGVRLLLVLLAANVSTTTAMGRPLAWMLIFTVVLVGMVLRRGPSLRWIPVIMLAWGNLHGGWANGFIVLGAAVFAETVKLIFGRGGDVVWLRRLILWSLAGVVALTLNPYGFDQLLVPFNTLTQAALPYINEWLPPNLLDPTRFGYVVLLAAGALVLIFERRRIPLLSALLLIGFGLWGLRTSRIVLIYTFIAPILLAPYLSDFFRRYAPSLHLPDYRLNQPVRFGLPVIIIFGVGVIALFITGSRPARILEIQQKSEYPVGAVAFLQTSNVAERELFNNYNWGGYLIYSLRDYPVFIDGRGDLYQDMFFVYQRIVTAQDGWQAQLSEYGINTILVTPDSKLADALLTDPGWTLAYQESSAVVYTRR